MASGGDGRGKGGGHAMKQGGGWKGHTMEAGGREGAHDGGYLDCSTC